LADVSEEAGGGRWSSDAMGDVRPETVIAIDAVAKALGRARGRVGAGEVTLKGARDVVTATDVAIEDEVRSALADSLGAAVIGEERGGEGDDTRSYWIVDPICGTRNFASGIPLYCTNLAQVEDGRVTVAAVGDGSTGEILVAQEGGGAWALADGTARPLRATADSQTLIIEDSHAAGPRRERAANIAAAAIRANRWDLRSLSTTLSLAYVAAGRAAGYVLFWTSATHAAAGSLLATEAGALVSDLDGRPWTIGSDSLVAAADSSLHSQLLALARDATES
jgi:myo-inositol-1(or 4)-monophosphatase